MYTYRKVLLMMMIIKIELFIALSTTLQQSPKPYLSMMPKSCFLTSCALLSVRIWTKFS